MTPDELRSVFHVDHHSLVPDYHLVHLIHHLERRNIATSQTHHPNSFTSGKTPHEKSKSKPEPPSLLDDEMFTKVDKYKDDIIGDLNSSISLNFNETSGEVDDRARDVHNIDLEAFGRQLKLVLKKQEGLLKKDGLRMWRVLTNESQPHGVDYEEMKSVSYFHC